MPKMQDFTLKIQQPMTKEEAKQFDEEMKNYDKFLKQFELNQINYQINLLIEKYINIKNTQIDFKNKTSLTHAAQHQLLDQNIHLFEGIIKDLKQL